MVHSIKICRKEAKESKHHLELIEEANKPLSQRMQNLIQESQELINIFSAIIKKLQKPKPDNNDEKDESA